MQKVDKNEQKEEVVIEISGVKRSKQDRSQRTTQKIVEAALKLLQKQSFEEVSVEEIARDAGISVGGFYARFDSKEALLHWFDNNLLEQELEIRLDQFEIEHWRNQPLELAIRKYLERGALFLRKYRTLLARISLQLRGNPEQKVAQRARDFNERTHAPILQLLRERKSEIKHPNPELAARLGLMTVSSALREAILFDQRRSYRITASDRKLVDELTLIYLSYLGLNKG